MQLRTITVSVSSCRILANVLFTLGICNSTYINSKYQFQCSPPSSTMRCIHLGFRCNGYGMRGCKDSGAHNSYEPSFCFGSEFQDIADEFNQFTGFYYSCSNTNGLRLIATLDNTWHLGRHIGHLYSLLVIMAHWLACMAPWSMSSLQTAKLLLQIEIMLEMQFML